MQTLWTDSLTAAPGSVSQVRESAARLVRYAKETGTAVFLIGHVTKDGGIAGPRVLEHMVDAVLYFEGESGSRFRVLRAFKNRFGAVNELGVFAMGEKGLKEVPNPSAIFLSGGSTQQPGSCVMVTREGTRPLLVEVQALVDSSPLSNPRRVAVGLEQNRLAMLLAVLHRHGGIVTSDQDVFVNVVGGIRVQETAADLPVLLAVLSSLRDKPLAEKTIAFGEVGLSGEIRPIPNGEERLREAATHGFKRAIVAKGECAEVGCVQGDGSDRGRAPVRRAGTGVNPFLRVDQYLMRVEPRPGLSGIRRFCLEFLWFGIKEARACMFAGLFFVAVFMTPKAGLLGVPRYDALLLIALTIQIWMVWAKLETLDELKAVCLFHVVGFALEVFKTSSSIQSWSYPDFAYSKLFGVPLFSGFMYAAVGSYIHPSLAPV